MKLSHLVCAVIAATALCGEAHALDDDDDVVLRPSDIVAQAPAEVWRPVDPDDTLIIDLPAGDVIVELRPDFAPKHVAQIKTLVRDGFYDGLTFHRVLEGYVAQGGDPKADGTGGSSLPNIQGEFVRDAKDVAGFVDLGRDRIAARVGFINGVPVAAQPETLRSFRTDRRVELWPLHCPGMMSMARAADPDSGNSQFFLMLGDARLDLDRRYSFWGWIVDGAEASRRIVRGDPPSRPTPIIRMRIAADIPEAERPKVEVMRTESETFRRYVEASGWMKDGYVRDMCQVRPPRRVAGMVEL